MAREKRQRVRFTGKRTGLEAIVIKGVGVVSQNQQIEITVEQADRWTTPLPMADDKEGTDWITVGEPFSVDEDEAAEREEEQREKLVAKATADEPKDEGPTVEEEAKALRESDATHDTAKPKGKGA